MKILNFANILTIILEISNLVTLFFFKLQLKMFKLYKRIFCVENNANYVLKVCTNLSLLNILLLLMANGNVHARTKNLVQRGKNNKIKTKSIMTFLIFHTSNKYMDTHLDPRHLSAST